MRGYFFTDEVRQILVTARDEAARLRHDQVDTRHILLAFTNEAPACRRLLSESSADPDAIRAGIQVPPGHSTQTSQWELPYTSSAKKSIELAMVEARDLQHGFVGAEHLLLAILREDRAAALVLARHGVTEDAVRTRLVAKHPQDPGLPPKGSSRLDFLKTPIRWLRRIR